MNLYFPKQEILDSLEPFTHAALELFFIRDYDGRLSLIAPENLITKLQWHQWSQKFNPWLGRLLNSEEMSDILDRLRQESKKETQNACTLFWHERTPHLGSWLNPAITPNENTLNTTLVTFYSYKGGVGRSTLAAAAALELSSQNHRVVLIDADLEAPGVPWYFYPSQKFGEMNPVRHAPGLVEYLVLHLAKTVGHDQNPLSIAQFIFGDDQSYPNLHIISACNPSNMNTYPQSVGRLNFNDQSKDSLNIMIAQVKDYLNPDFIIFDARTGLTDIGGLLTNQLCDYSVFVGYPDDQTQAGLDFFAHHIKFSTDEFGNMSLPALWVHSPAQKREGEVDPYEHQKFILQVRSSLQATNRFEESVLHDLFGSESEWVLSVSYEDDLRAILRKDGISGVRKKTTFRQYMEQVSNRLVIFRPINHSKANEKPKTVATSNEESRVDFEIIINELKQAKPIGSMADNMTEDQLTDFYPTPNLRNMFDLQRFLVLGDKGSGKTTLERMFYFIKDEQRKEKFAELISSAGKKPQLPRNWITVLGAHNFNDAQSLDEDFSSFGEKEFRRFWAALIALTLKKLQVPGIAEMQEARRQANVSNYETIHEELKAEMSSHSEPIILTFDRLDDVFVKNLSPAINSLVWIWWGFLSGANSMVGAKIFLRTDLFRKEIFHPNKGHMASSFSLTLDWKFEELLAAILKRLLQRSPTLVQKMQDQLNTVITKSDFLGYLPDYNNEKWLIAATRMVFGERITQPFAEVWLKRYMVDGRGQYSARFSFELLKRLVAESGSTTFAVFDTYSTIKKVYWEHTSYYLEHEFLEMYPDLKSIIKAMQAKTDLKEIIKEGTRFKLWLETCCSPDFHNPDEAITRMEETGLISPVDRQRNSSIKFPDMYRVPLYISVSNGLPPKPR